MRYVSLVAGFARGLVGKRPRLGAVVAVAAMMPVGMWGQATWLPAGATSGPIYYNGGNVGIGTTSPTKALTVNIPTAASSDDGLLIERYWGASSFGFRMKSDTNGYFRGALTAKGNGFAEQEVMTFGLDSGNIGNVGIGTTNPQHLLHVAGTIGATQIIVSATGADYVFAPTYRLQPLPEVASYIKANGHLPGIPAAEEVEAKGVNLGDMQSKLLAKVEELTLHMIAADERNNRLERQSLDLEKQNRELQERLARLEAGQATH